MKTSVDTPLWNELRNPGCTECPLWETAQTVCLIGAGKLEPEVMLVGEAPGFREDEIAKPFAGKAGQLLDRLLSEFDLPREEVYISNAVHCRPPENRTPKWQEVLTCRKYLIAEVERVRPKLIIALGNIACLGLLNVRKFAIGENRGNTLRIPEDHLAHIPVIPTYHPAAILRKDYYLNLVLEDFERAINLLKRGSNGSEPVEAKYYKGYAKPITDHVVVDLETTGFDPWAIGGDILCIGTSISDTRGYCDPSIEGFREVLADKTVTKVGHNLKFDVKWLVTHGYKVRGPWRDTMIAAHLLDENYPSKGLKEQAMLHTDMGDYSAKLRRSLQLLKSMAKVDPRVREKYCAQDADATHRLDTLFNPQLKEQGLWPLYELMMEGTKVITEAELFGFNIDQTKRLELRSIYIRAIDKLSHELEDASGMTEFNPNSPDQLSYLLFNKLGFPIIKQTPTGKLSTDEFVLQKLKEVDKSGVISKILELRSLSGDYSKYLTPEKELFKSDGRVHCDYKVTGTVTGRWSCKNPNLQQVPRESRIKELFISSFPEGSILQVDYSQGELRLLAEYSRDKRLLRIFDEGKYDIHLAVAAQMLGKSPEDVTKEERKRAKTVNFGILYGEGPKKLAGQLGVSYHSAMKYLKAYMDNYRGVQKWIKEIHTKVLEEGEVTSLFGRKRRLTVIDADSYQGWEALRQGVNSPVQGGLHDLNVLSFVAVRKEMRKQGCRSKIIADVHDAVLFDVYPGEEEDLQRLVKPIFENPDTSKFGFEFRVPLKVSMGLGKTWKEAYEKESA